MLLYSIKPLAWVNGKAETSWLDTFVIQPYDGRKYKFMLMIQNPMWTDGDYPTHLFKTVDEAIAKADEIYLKTLHHHLKLES